MTVRPTKRAAFDRFASHRGFTLVELLIGIAISSIVLAVIIGLCKEPTNRGHQLLLC